MIAASISTKFIAVDAFSPAVKTMERNISHFAEKANAGIARQERLFRRLTPHLGHATKQLLSYASAGAVLGGLAYSGKAIMDYETAIQSLSAVTGVSGKQLDDFKVEITDLATKTKKSATDVAGSFEVIGSMMSQYLTDPKALKQIADSGITLAKASRQELVPTLENLTSIMNQFNITAAQSDDTIQKLTAGEIVGSLKTAQVAQSLQQFGANAATANVSLAESVALVEALAKQRPAENLGIDARNILLVMDSAKALDKKARKSLRSAGVDMGFLMDKTHSLSERIHELSKIQGSQVGMAHVFGERNVTAAKVIFQQLGTYDAYLAKIKVTNEAQHQAAINSDTLAVKVDQLRATWINYIATGGTAEKGLNKLKEAIGFVAQNLDTIVTVGINVIGFFAIWKTALIAARIATTAYSVALGINNVITGASIGLLEADAVAQRVSMIAKQANAIATAGLTANIEMLSVAMAANPVGLAIVAFTALAGAMYLASKESEKLKKAFQDQIAVDTVTYVNKETEAVKKLVAEYWHLGMGIKDATAAAIKFRLSQIDRQRHSVDQRIKQTNDEIAQDKKNHAFRNYFIFRHTGIDLSANSELQSKLYEQQKTAHGLASAKTSEMQFAQDQIAKGNIGASDLGNSFGKSNPGNVGGNSSWVDQFQERDKKEEFRFGHEQPKQQSELQFDYVRMGAEIAKALKGSQQEIKLTGLPQGVTATASGTNISTPNQ